MGASKVLGRKLQTHNKELPTVIHSRRNLQNMPNQMDDALLNDDSVYLVTGDVEGLYPNILIDRLSMVLRKHVDTTGRLSDLSDCIGSANIVTDGFQVFSQKIGLPMGGAHCVEAANIYMYYLFDQKFLKEDDNKHKGLIGFGRYIDDLILIWKGSLKHLEELLEFSQSICPRVKINWSKPSKSAIFMDLLIRLNVGSEPRLEYEIYYKPISRFLYLPFGSFHQASTLRSWVRQEALRIMECCNIQSSATRNLIMFRLRLRQRGYPFKWVNQRFNEALGIKRKLKTEDSPKKAPIPFIIRDTLRTRAVRPSFHLRNNLPTKYPLKPVTAYRKPKSLLALLQGNLIPASMNLAENYEKLQGNLYEVKPKIVYGKKLHRQSSFDAKLPLRSTTDDIVLRTSTSRCLSIRECHVSK